MNRACNAGKHSRARLALLRRSSCCVAVLALMFVCSVSAEQENQGSSPSGEIEWQLREGTDESKRIWLFPRERPNEAVELCDTQGWGYLKVHFAPDDSWLIVQDGGASLGVSLRLFRREAGVRFNEVQDADLDGKIERAALADARRPAKEALDHRYANVLAWSADSRSVLVKVSGTGSRNNRALAIEGWTAVYDLASDGISFDLKKFNRRAVTETKLDAQ